MTRAPGGAPSIFILRGSNIFTSHFTKLRYSVAFIHGLISGRGSNFRGLSRECKLRATANADAPFEPSLAQTNAINNPYIASKYIDCKITLCM